MDSKPLPTWRTPEYIAWRNMMSRCLNRKHPQFKYYGGRGITVDPRYRTFANFLADLGPRPSPQHSLDRIRPGRHYEKGNLRWATKTEQEKTKRSSVTYEWEGRDVCLAELAQAVGMRYTTAYARIREKGIHYREALATPVRQWGNKTG